MEASTCRISTKFPFNFVRSIYKYASEGDKPSYKKWRQGIPLLKFIMHTKLSGHKMSVLSLPTYTFSHTYFFASVTETRQPPPLFLYHGWKLLILSWLYEMLLCHHIKFYLARLVPYTKNILHKQNFFLFKKNLRRNPEEETSYSFRFTETCFFSCSHFSLEKMYTTAQTHIIHERYACQRTFFCRAKQWKKNHPCCFLWFRQVYT